MSRIEIKFPDKIAFSTYLNVRITDINYGGHLGNDRVLSMIHEARMQFLNHFGYSELNIEGIGLIMADAGIKFKSEAFYNDLILIEIAIVDLTKVGFDLYYRLSCSEKVIALAKTGMLFFDYDKRKITACPEMFVKKFQNNY